jgi:hypothetical protein
MKAEEVKLNLQGDAWRARLGTIKKAKLHILEHLLCRHNIEDEPLPISCGVIFLSIKHIPLR